MLKKMRNPRIDLGLKGNLRKRYSKNFTEDFHINTCNFFENLLNQKSKFMGLKKKSFQSQNVFDVLSHFPFLLVNINKALFWNTESLQYILPVM